MYLFYNTPCSTSHVLYPLKHIPTPTAYNQLSYDCGTHIVIAYHLIVNNLLECFNVLVVIQFMIRIISLVVWYEQKTLSYCSTRKKSALLCGEMLAY